MKKNILLLMVMIALTSLATAQTEKGRFYISGKSGLEFTSMSPKFYYDKEQVMNGGTTTTFKLTPSVEYFVVDNLSIGLGVGLDFTQVKDEDGDISKSTTSTVMPGLTYFFPLEGQIKPFISTGAGLVSSSHGTTDEDKFNGFGFGGSAGVAIFLNEKVSLNLGLGYTKVQMKNKDDKKFEAISGGFGSFVGFSVYF